MNTEFLFVAGPCNQSIFQESKHNKMQYYDYEPIIQYFTLIPLLGPSGPVLTEIMNTY